MLCPSLRRGAALPHAALQRPLPPHARPMSRAGCSSGAHEQISKSRLLEAAQAMGRRLLTLSLYNLYDLKVGSLPVVFFPKGQFLARFSADGLFQEQCARKKKGHEECGFQLKPSLPPDLD